MVFIWTKFLAFTQMLLITDGAAEKKSHVTETKEQERNKPEKNMTFLG